MSMATFRLPIVGSPRCGSWSTSRVVSSAASGAGSSRTATQEASAMSTFVLVHGSMHGGWCWKRVAPLLRAAGHDVHTPILTGPGERVHLAHSGIDLDTHIRDVLGVLEFEDLHDVVLLGHSYGTMVITGVADRAPERIAHLVYLDGVMAGEGQAALDFSHRSGVPHGERRWMPTARAGAC